MNKLEVEFVNNLTSIDNIKWWHRNSVKDDDSFCINGFINHYPDFIIMTMSSKIILAETKGEFLDNEDTAQKIKLGDKWAQKAGEDYRYYMIFDDTSKDNISTGVTNISKFIKMIKYL